VINTQKRVKRKRQTPIVNFISSGNITPKGKNVIRELIPGKITKEKDSTGAKNRVPSE
jgi:hypothetical protein